MIRESLHLVPLRRDLHQAKLVFALIIASLGVFFLATIVSYIIIRTQSFQPIKREYVPLEIPVTFWASTALLIVVSVFLERACWFVRRELQAGFLGSLRIAFVVSIAFTILQAFGLQYLLSQHFLAYDGSTKAYGMSFTIAFVHALHVVGGIGFIGYIWFQGRRNRYDHERHWAVNHCAGYWHFLDVVWLGMLATFVITR